MMFDTAADLYQRAILERGRQPRHGRRLAAHDASARGHNPLCGDRCEVFVRHDEGGRVLEVGFEARGCAVSIASADFMSEAVVGLDDRQARALRDAFAVLATTGRDTGEAAAALRPLTGVHNYPSRVKCAMLPWQALVAALDGEKETGHG